MADTVVLPCVPNVDHVYLVESVGHPVRRDHYVAHVRSSDYDGLNPSTRRCSEIAEYVAETYGRPEVSLAAVPRLFGGSCGCREAARLHRRLLLVNGRRG
jgi:hypothetical protein